MSTSAMTHDEAILELANTAALRPIGHELITVDKFTKTPVLTTLTEPPEHDELAYRTAIDTLTSVELSALILGLRESEARLTRDLEQRADQTDNDTTRSRAPLAEPPPPPLKTIDIEHVKPASTYALAYISLTILVALALAFALTPLLL